MCGIFGYIGNKPNAANIVFEGLKTLEYRGYDSWGIALQNQKLNSKNQKKITLEKETGKLPEKILNSQFSTLNSNLGIGHTRWATHGGVTVANAHPHLDCTKKIAVIHNGIIENFQELKESLLKKGHLFSSETDTEILPHLLEEVSKGKKVPNVPKGRKKAFDTFDTSDTFDTFPEALRQVFNQLKGLNAIVAINTETEEIVAAKNGSPLIVGIGKNELFLSSDLTGILPHTKKVIFMKDNELVALRKVPKETNVPNVPKGRKKAFDTFDTSDTFDTFSLGLFSLPGGKQIKPEVEVIDWKVESAVKGRYAHFMLKEIYEQPLIIETIAKTYTKQIEKLSTIIRKARGTFFIGSGTAYHACLAGTYLFSKIAHRHVNTAPASEFNYLEDFLTSESLIIPLSQSGETIDVIEPLNRAKQKGSTIMSVVNALGSTLYRMGDYKLLLGAGPEKAVASTKAYTAKISILTLLAYALAGKLTEGKKLLLQTAKEVNRLLKKHSLDQIKTVAKLLANKEHIYIIGRGGSHATALEGALKIKEVSYIHTEGLAGGELKHGTIALIDKGTPCIVLAPDDETYDAIISNATEIKARGGLIIGISHKQAPIFDAWIEVKAGGSPLITQILPFQLLAYHLAVLKKLDPDKPRNLAKSVTVK